MWGALFPGQGSQSVGMGRFLFEEFVSAKRLFEEAGDTLKVDFKKLCFDGPESDLQLTENTQPALLLVSTVSFRVVSELMPLKISMGAGHSAGEYAALVANHTLEFPEALKAVRRRGQAMQAAVPVGQGAMCAVLGLSDEAVIKMCEIARAECGEKGLNATLEPANFNSPGQVVVSGSTKAVDWLRKTATAEWVAQNLGPEAGRAKLIPLAVSAPFHCALMKPAENEMRKVLEATEFKAPGFPVVQNLVAKASTSTSEIRQRLIGQISGAVLWSKCQGEMIAQGADRYVEFGSGKVLAGLAKKIAGDKVRVFNLNSLNDLKALEIEAKGNSV